MIVCIVFDCVLLLISSVWCRGIFFVCRVLRFVLRLDSIFLMVVCVRFLWVVEVSVILESVVVVFGRFGVCFFLKYGMSVRLFVLVGVFRVRWLSLLWLMLRSVVVMLSMCVVLRVYMSGRKCLFVEVNFVMILEVFVDGVFDIVKIVLFVLIDIMMFLGFVLSLRVVVVLLFVLVVMCWLLVFVIYLLGLSIWGRIVLWLSVVWSSLWL